MSTVRVKKDGHYFTASNIPFNDERLSWEARGVMGYLLSKPNDWTISRTDLIKRGDAGRDKIQRILKELEECGYVDRVRRKRPDGTFYYETTVYEVPTVDGFAVHGSPVNGKPVHLISTDLTNDESTNKSATKRASLSPVGENFKDTPVHPAIQAIKQVTGYYPRKNLHKRIIDLVGETPDITEIKKAFDTWTANGYNPMNMKGWLFDWYKERMYYLAPQQKL